jgi:hypothetical protein
MNYSPEDHAPEGHAASEEDLSAYANLVPFGHYDCHYLGNSATRNMADPH